MTNGNHEGPTGPREFVWWLVAAIVVIGATFVIPKMEGIRDHTIAIVALAVVARLITFFRTQLFKGTVLIAFGSGLLFAAFLGYVFRSYLLGPPPPPPRTIRYISPVQFPSKQGFYRRFIEELLHQAKAAGFELVISVPDRDFSVADQRALLEDAEKKPPRYTAVIFTPFETGDDEDWLLHFTSEMGPNKVVLFDTDFPKGLQERLVEKHIDVPQCISSNEGKAGQLAGEYVVQYLKAHKLRSPKIAVMDERGTSLRSEAFLRAIRSAPDLSAQTEVWQTREFSREEGKQLAVQKLVVESRTVDIIFSGNDALALGVRDAILQLRSRKKPMATQPIRIMGYDGTEDVYDVLRDPNESIMLNSVNVGVPDEVRKIVSLVSSKRPRSYGASCDMTEPFLIR